MKLLKLLQHSVVALASVGLLVPQLALAAKPVASNSIVKDVALQNGGVLRGYVVDAQGKGLEREAVRVAANGTVVATSSTDANGHFAVAGLSTGVYQVQTATTSDTYRVWDANVAPPAAMQGAMLVDNSETVRGQSCGCPPGNCSCTGKAGGGWLRHLGSPWVLGGIVAAAIAIPLALDDDDAS